MSSSSRVRDGVLQWHGKMKIEKSMVCYRISLISPRTQIQRALEYKTTKAS